MRVIAAFCMVLCFVVAKGQGVQEYQSGMLLHINNNSSRFIRFITWNQIWLRSQHNNPGTMINGELRNYT